MQPDALGELLLEVVPERRAEITPAPFEPTLPGRREKWAEGTKPCPQSFRRPCGAPRLHALAPMHNPK
jgi:hypothetical protein